MLVLLSTTLHIICETFIDRTLHTVCTHTQFFSLVVFWKWQTLKKEFIHLFIIILVAFIAACGCFLLCRDSGYSVVPTRASAAVALPGAQALGMGFSSCVGLSGCGMDLAAP